jgi:catechol 2,3-dioxygenase-like lactoylglutathione lyase family enzyme
MKTEKRQSIGYVALIVRDYDEAIDYYTRALGFEVVEDTTLTDTKRWVLLAAPGSVETRLLLAKAFTPVQIARIGDQTGGRVFLFLHTDDFQRDYLEMTARGVKFLRSSSRRVVRHRRGVRGSLRQSMGFVAATTLAAHSAGVSAPSVDFS